jgi:UDP-GlcNAc:undecaprenyl-phosphate GlcNAc-1-phosphate transferase
MLIGLVLGALALRSGGKESATVAAAPLVAMWAVLILDSVAALARRKLTGRSMYDCDRGHIHHRLLERGFTATQTSAIIAGLCGVTSLSAVASLYFERPILGLIMAGLVIGALAFSRVFGHVELALARARIVQARQSSMGKPSKAAVQIQGDPRWEKLWQSSMEAAERYELIELQLNLHAARQHQDFYANWTDKNQQAEPANCWRIERPFVVEGVVVGRMMARGVQEKGVERQIAFLEFTDSLVTQVRSLVDRGVERPANAVVPMAETSADSVGLAKS